MINITIGYINTMNWKVQAITWWERETISLSKGSTVNSRSYIHSLRH